MSEKSKYVLLTGVPGIGKTTVIKKVCKQLLEKNCRVAGFYTEEMRDKANQRIGFDVIALNGQRASLARNMKLVKPFEMTQFKVGQYVVFPGNFEKVIMPLFNQANVEVLIIDEIGKMELFSEKFKDEIEKVFNNPNVTVLATIPVPKNQPIPIVDALRTNPKCEVITVDRTNRNELLDVICNKIL